MAVSLGMAVCVGRTMFVPDLQGPVTRYFPFHDRVDDIPKENVLKVLTYNVMGFGYKGHTEDAPNPIIRYIANSGADIVCLQEYAVGTSKNF